MFSCLFICVFYDKLFEMSLVCSVTLINSIEPITMSYFFFLLFLFLSFIFLIYLFKSISMNEEYTERKLDQTSSYSSKNSPDNAQLIDRLLSTLHQRLDDAQQYKNTFNKNPSQTTIYQVLYEIKNKTRKITFTKEK